MIITHNNEASFTNRSLGITNKALAKSVEKLASGYRVNRAADDAAGLGISEEMRSQIRGLDRGAKNTDEAIQLCQTADGAMQELEDIIHRIRELGVQAANDTNTDDDRRAIQNEVDELIAEVDRITWDTEYNTIKIFQKSRMCTTYEVINGTKMVPVKVEITNVVGSNYGITEVLGEDKVYSGTRMDDPLEFTGIGWHQTGRTPSVASMNVCTCNANGNQTSSYPESDIISYLSKEYGITAASTSSMISQNIVSQDGKSEITLDYGTILSNGDRLLTGFSVSTYDKDVSDPTSVLVEKVNASGIPSAEGTSGLGNTTKYGSAWFDFSGLGTDYTIDSLYGQAFNTVCSQGCGVHYNIIFTDEAGNKTTADGTNYTYSTENNYKIIKLNISDCTSGADIVKKVMSAAENEIAFTEHWNQFAYNDSEPAKLYIYDSMAGWMKDKFQPIAWTESHSETTTVTKWIEVPNTTTWYKWEDYDMNIQVGSNAMQLVQLKRPYLNADILGISSINVATTNDGSLAVGGVAMDMCDYALNKLNLERAYIGAMTNRFNHAYDENLNSSENLQSSESLIRDIDVADEMVQFSAKSIIQQAAQSMLAQANNSKQGILVLLR